jgi:hypothetical protein
LLVKALASALVVAAVVVAPVEVVEVLLVTCVALEVAWTEPHPMAVATEAEATVVAAATAAAVVLHPTAAVAMAVATVVVVAATATQAVLLVHLLGGKRLHHDTSGVHRHIPFQQFSTYFSTKAMFTWAKMQKHLHEMLITTIDTFFGIRPTRHGYGMIHDRQRCFRETFQIPLQLMAIFLDKKTRGMAAATIDTAVDGHDLVTTTEERGGLDDGIDDESKVYRFLRVFHIARNHDQRTDSKQATKDRLWYLFFRYEPGWKTLGWQSQRFCLSV